MRGFNPHGAVASFCRGSAAIAFFALTLLPAAAQQINIQPPAEGNYVLDLAYMIEDEHEKEINETVERLLSEQAIPIIVVTIEGMNQHGGAGMRIETFALLLFNQWGVGIEEFRGETWNKGILLVVSKADRVARIQLGDGWDRQKDVLAQQIMDDQIITRFKQGKFSEGILHGVLALEKMARGEELPGRPTSWLSVALVIGFIGLAIFTVVSLIRRGASGWAWLFWGAVFSILGYLLYSALTNRGGGGNFSGGAFGGGFSGGGGATGSW